MVLFLVEDSKTTVLIQQLKTWYNCCLFITPYIYCCNNDPFWVMYPLTKLVTLWEVHKLETILWDYIYDRNRSKMSTSLTSSLFNSMNEILCLSIPVSTLSLSFVNRVLRYINLHEIRRKHCERTKLFHLLLLWNIYSSHLEKSDVLM